MKYLLALMICLSLGAEELLVSPKTGKVAFIDEQFSPSTNNGRIRPPKNMNWEVINGEYVGTPKDNATTKPQALMYLWTPNPYNGFLMQFDFKFKNNKADVEFHLGRHYVKIRIKGDHLEFCREEMINGKIERITQDLGIKIIPNRWNKFHIETYQNRYVIKINKEKAIFTESIGSEQEKFGGLRITGTGTEKFYLDNLVQKAITGPTSELENKIVRYKRIGPKRSEGVNSILAQANPNQSKVEIKKDKQSTPTASSPSKPIKVTKNDKLIFI